MFDFGTFGKLFIYIGLIFLAIGAMFTFFKHIPLLGKLPGDILISKKNFTFYFPLTTSILLSILVSLLFYLISRK